MSDSEIWIGLLHVRPREGNDCLEDAIGAFVSVVALANNVECFGRIAAELLEGMEFDVVEIKDVEPWSVRIQNFHVAKDIRDLTNTLTPDHPAAFGPFDCYLAIEE